MENIFFIWFGTFMLSLLVLWILATLFATLFKVEPDGFPLQTIAFAASLVLTAFAYVFGS